MSAVAWFVIGCGDAERGASHADASALFAADSGSGSLQLDGAQADGNVAASRFEIAFSTSDCKAQCPSYDIKLDQGGSVLFYGHRHTRLQGWFGKMVAPEIASELLDAIVATNYWELQHVYREEGDGCSEVEMDRATHVWSVSMDGPAKTVVDYQGCKGVRELEALRKLPAQLIEKLGLASYLDH